MFYTDPWFWAFVAMFGLQGGTLVVSGHRLGRRVWFVTLVLTLVTVGRLLLVLPFCPQPRMEITLWTWVFGLLFLAAAGAIGLPALTIKWWRAPEAGMTLRTSGVYGIVRHPMYLSEILWPIGWSLLWGSIYGLALTPVWWLGFLFHVLIEESQLEQKLGPQYTEYKQQVRGRIFPSLPF